MRLLETRLAHRARRSRALRPLGIAVYRGVDRLTPAPPGPRVIVNSMPKSGTHLVTQLLDQVDGMRFSGHVVMYTPSSHAQEDQATVRTLERHARKLRPSHYLAGHLTRVDQVEDALRPHDVRLLTILRDPRAVVLSGMNYLYNATWMPHRDELMAMLPDQRAVLEYLVRGHGEPQDRYYCPDIGEHYRGYAAWAGSDIGMTLRFEDLVGPDGGGSRDAQLHSVGEVLRYLELPADERIVATVAAGAFSAESITFNGGQVAAWRDQLPADLVDEINERCAPEMASLGYV